MTITPELAVALISTSSGTVLYILAQILAFAGKPKWAANIRWLSKMLDWAGANHNKAANLLESEPVAKARLKK